MSERLHQLMQQIADEAARIEIDSTCGTLKENDLTWYCALPLDDDEHSLGRAIEYLELRNRIEYSADGKLVRFVEEGE